MDKYSFDDNEVWVIGCECCMSVIWRRCVDSVLRRKWNAKTLAQPSMLQFFKAEWIFSPSDLRSLRDAARISKVRISKVWLSWKSCGLFDSLNHENRVIPQADSPFGTLSAWGTWLCYCIEGPVPHSQNCMPKLQICSPGNLWIQAHLLFITCAKIAFPQLGQKYSYMVIYFFPPPSHWLVGCVFSEICPFYYEEDFFWNLCLRERRLRKLGTQ